MKPIPAIVEPAIDVDLIAEHCIVAIADLSNAERAIARLTGQLDAARTTADQRRLDLGRWLVQVRPTWPERGPSAKGWGEFLRRIGLEQSTAWRYMDALKPGFMQPHETPDPPVGDRDGTPANVIGGSGEAPRGTYCTPKKYALAVGPWDLDPFSNPRSHIVSHSRCMLEDGGDGLAKGCSGTFQTADGRLHIAQGDTRVWLQPPYSRGFVERVVEHYGHTRFCALLRFAPDTDWFEALWPRVTLIAAPRERLPFETPDGVELEGADEGEDRGAPFPHVFYYADERDATPAIRELCIMLRRDEALHLVR